MLVTISPRAPEFCCCCDASPAGRGAATGMNAATRSSMARLLHLRTGGNMPTNTPPNRKPLNANRAATVGTRRTATCAVEGAADADAAQQREREEAYRAVPGALARAQARSAKAAR